MAISDHECRDCEGNHKGPMSASSEASPGRAAAEKTTQTNAALPFTRYLFTHPAGTAQWAEDNMYGGGEYVSQKTGTMLFSLLMFSMSQRELFTL